VIVPAYKVTFVRWFRASGRGIEVWWISLSALRVASRSGRADIYALGAVAYFLLVGETVFRGSTVVEVCTQHLYATPLLPSQRLGVAVPATLEALIMRCLGKEPASRFPNAAALLEALARLADVEPWSEQQLPFAVARTRRGCRRRRG
jgi:serine/threonine protein kinase